MGRKEREYKSLQQFWPYYLSEHQNFSNQIIHASGSLIALIWLAGAAIIPAWQMVPIAFAHGYGYAWVGHFAFEGNRPTTLQYPVWSFICDWRLTWRVITGGNTDPGKESLGEPAQ